MLLKFRCPAITDMLNDGVNEGARDESAFVLARWYRQHCRGIWINLVGSEILMEIEAYEVEILLTEWNKKNRPPLPTWQTRKCINSAFEGALMSVGCASLQKNPQLKKLCSKHRKHCKMKHFLKHEILERDLF